MDQDVLDFVDKLVNGSPELAAVHREHLADQDGELLPHVLLGSISRLVVACALRDECPGWLTLLVRQLEAGLSSGSEEVAELVGVSFVENLCGETEALAMLLPRMGQAMRQEVKAICGV